MVATRLSVATVLANGIRRLPQGAEAAIATSLSHGAGIGRRPLRRDYVSLTPFEDRTTRRFSFHISG